MLESFAYTGSSDAGRGFSRRRFLKGVGALAVGGALLATGRQTLQLFPLPVASPEALVRSTFAQYVGDMFRLSGNGIDALPLQLVDVRNLPALNGAAIVTARAAEQSFGILLRGPANRPLTQNTYHFEHSRIGAFALFIVPMATDNAGTLYEAIFNRL